MSFNEIKSIQDSVSFNRKKAKTFIFDSNAVSVSYKKLIRRQIFFTEWKKIKMKLKRLTRLLALWYEKLKDDQVNHFVHDVFENIDEENVIFQKIIIKIQSNNFIWKHRTLAFLKVSVWFMYLIII